MGVVIQIEALKFVIGWFGSVGGFTEVDRSGGSRTQLNMMCAYASLSLFNGVNHQNPETRSMESKASLCSYHILSFGKEMTDRAPVYCSVCFPVGLQVVSVSASASRLPRLLGKKGVDRVPQCISARFGSKHRLPHSKSATRHNYSTDRWITPRWPCTSPIEYLRWWVPHSHCIIPDGQI